MTATPNLLPESIAREAEFLALLAQVPADEREEVLRKLAAVESRYRLVMTGP